VVTGVVRMPSTRDVRSREGDRELAPEVIRAADLLAVVVEGGSWWVAAGAEREGDGWVAAIAVGERGRVVTGATGRGRDSRSKL
jgi:hypothetical protein